MLDMKILHFNSVKMKVVYMYFLIKIEFLMMWLHVVVWFP